MSLSTLAPLISAVYALVHLVPVRGVWSTQQLERLYGLSLMQAEPGLLLLLRHRAMLFAVIGILLLAAAWRPELRTQAGSLGLLSMLSYIVLQQQLGVEDSALVRVAQIDAALSALLAFALLAHLYTSAATGQS